MRRRDFLKTGLYGATAAGSLALGLPMRGVWAAGTPVIPRTLVDIMLYGGADLRYAFVPVPDHPDTGYVQQFWNARKGLFAQHYPDYAAMYSDRYQTVIDPLSGLAFGIHNSCGWLRDQFNNGNVAIVSNVFGSLNRRHDESQLIVNTGDAAAELVDPEREGWGGRLVEAVNGTSTVVSVSDNVSQFCKGSDPANRLSRVIHGKDMRDIGLPHVDYSSSVLAQKNIMARALAAYYRRRGEEVAVQKPADWAYHSYFQHFSSFYSIGSAVDARLAAFPMPAALNGLSLKKDSFKQQCSNLYDACLTADILDFRVIYMDYTDWDTHTNEQIQLDNNLADLFGSGGGLDVVTSQLAQDVPTAPGNLVYVLTTDFGRQLIANGSLGTDHGAGNYMLLIGESVNGGVNGELFPQAEALPDPADSLGRSPFQIPGSEIEGRTSFYRVLAEVCNWVAPGAGSLVFPGASSSALESGFNPADLFA